MRDHPFEGAMLPPPYFFFTVQFCLTIKFPMEKFSLCFKWIKAVNYRNENPQKFLKKSPKLVIASNSK